MQGCSTRHYPPPQAPPPPPPSLYYTIHTVLPVCVLIYMYIEGLAKTARTFATSTDVTRARTDGIARDSADNLLWQTCDDLL